MPNTARKLVARLVQLLLVVAGILVVGRWVGLGPLSRAKHEIHVSALATPPDSLGAGDMRIYNTDSTVDVVLVGNTLAAGLSPQMVAKIRTQMDSSAKGDSGLGGSIAALVKKSVAGAIGTHAEYPLSDVRDIRYENGRLVLDWKSGGNHSLFKDVNVNGKEPDNAFRQADADRFIAAVKARQRELAKRHADSTRQ